jgi:hypothetical protein
VRPLFKPWKWLSLATLLLLCACAAPPKTLYQWAGYQSALFDYFKNDAASPAVQITLLEAQVHKNASLREASPPGLHAHLALLYSKAGDEAKAVEHLEAERRLFPESAAYVGFLLKNAARPAAPP